MGIILENQAKQLVVEESNTGGGNGAGSFSPGTGAQWAGVALPLVRKVFGQIAAKEFVSCSTNELTFWTSILPRFPIRIKQNSIRSADSSLYGDAGTDPSTAPFRKH